MLTISRFSNKLSNERSEVSIARRQQATRRRGKSSLTYLLSRGSTPRSQRSIPSRIRILPSFAARTTAESMKTSLVPMAPS